MSLRTHNNVSLELCKELASSQHSQAPRGIAGALLKGSNLPRWTDELMLSFLQLGSLLSAVLQPEHGPSAQNCMGATCAVDQAAAEYADGLLGCESVWCKAAVASRDCMLDQHTSPCRICPS